jgi:hypothetical protein
MSDINFEDGAAGGSVYQIASVSAFGGILRDDISYGGMKILRQIFALIRC